MDATISGTVTATLTWVPTTGQTSQTDPPDKLVTIIEAASASYANATGVVGVGTADDGLKDPMVGNGISSGTHVLPPKDGTSGQIVIPDTLTAKSTPSPVPAPGTNANAGASFSVWPVTITGTTPVGGSQALTGQQLTAVLNVPPGFSVYQPTGQTGYQWTITGSLVNKVFKNYDPTLPSNQLTLLTAADLTAASPSFYDSAAETVSATCAVTLVAPDGTKLPLTVKSKDVSVLKPTASWGTNQYLPGIGFTNDPTNQRFEANELWYPLNITVPSPFSGGTGCLAQLITPSRRIARNALNGKPSNYYYKIPYTNPDGTTSWVLPGQGLDAGFPYPSGFTIDANGQPHPVMPDGGYTWDVSNTGYSGDSPAQLYTTGDLDGGGTNWYEATANDFFTTWIMYRPGGGVWVPLQKIDWSWDGNATKDTSGHWSVVGVANATASATTTNDPPQWNIALQANDQLHP